MGLKSPAHAELGFSVPLVKSAIFSGTNGKSKQGNSILYLDGNNTYGLSGAPVFFYDYYLKTWRIVGMVTGYLKQTNKIFNTTSGKFEIREENSGIISSIGHDQILKLINKNRN